MCLTETQWREMENVHNRKITFVLVLLTCGWVKDHFDG